jgi:hypothetical protein
VAVKINKSFAPRSRDIRYLAKTFAEHRQNLIDYAKVYFPNTNADFNEASPGMMFMDMAAYIGDVLGYYIDTNFRENLLSYAQQENNVIAIAQSMGYKPHPGTAATCDVDVFQLCPAKGAADDYVPDEQYYVRLAPPAIFASVDSPVVNFRTIEEVNFADPADREITVYATDINNRPLTYLVKKKARVVAGTIKTHTVTIGAPERFLTIRLPDTNVLDIISVVDGDNNAWHQVDYLAQDLVFDDTVNTSASDDDVNFSTPPSYVLKLRRTPRRFVTRYTEDFQLEVQFGSGILEDSDATINLEPRKLANSEYQTNLGSTSLDPSDFLSSNSYGSVPNNTTLTFSYVVGGGVESNAASNTITKVITVTPTNSTSAFTPQERALWGNVVQSLAVNNPEPATGGKGRDTIEEIRQGALGFFNAQNRLVTAEDYIARTHAMPARYGSVAKVFVTKDDQINEILRTSQQQAPNSGVYVSNQPGPGIINLYVLGYNSRGSLTTLNSQSKQNLKSYLDQYRMLTDNVRILDAFVVNIGVKFKVVVYKNYNMNEVIARCIDAMQEFFNVKNWQINQPIILNDVWLELGNVEGVQTVVNVEIFNRYQYKDGSDYQDFIYDIPSATNNGIIWPSLDPTIFEIRYPERDIIGSASQ